MPLAPIDEIDLARAQEYALLAALLGSSPDAAMLARLSRLPGDESVLGVAHSALARAASRAEAQRVKQEHFRLFVGIGRGELLPYASYYLTGALHGAPLASIRQTLARIGVERADAQAEAEDHAAMLLELMAALVGGTIPAHPGADREVFEAHLAPWIGKFFADLERSESADFYASVAVLGRTFLEIERQGFLLAK